MKLGRDIRPGDVLHHFNRGTFLVLNTSDIQGGILSVYNCWGDEIVLFADAHYTTREVDIRASHATDPADAE